MVLGLSFVAILGLVLGIITFAMGSPWSGGMQLCIAAANVCLIMAKIGGE